MPSEPAPDRSDATLVPRAAPAMAFASGRYTVRGMLGEGGQKVVYLVHDEALDRDCALSMVKSELLEADDLERLRREAQAMARLGAHSNIVTVHDIGDEDGKPYLVCEYVPAGELRRHLRDASTPLALERALAIAADIARALAIAHGRGVVHRDVKPANVWLCDDGSAKLGDFGLAFSIDRTRMTLPGSVMGTATYMAPEQARGEPVDARTDLYALGVVLYEMVCGRPPFTGDDPLSVISQHASVAPAAPVVHAAGVPPRLNDLILRLLAKSPELRPESASLVLEELRTITESLRVPEQVESEPEEPENPPAAAGFVGRTPELEQLSAALDRTTGGAGSLVMVVGEPGIGKTRLIEQFTAHARAAGARVLMGRCYDGDWAPPFSPFVEAIKQHAASTPPQRLRAQLGADAGVLARIVPSLHERLSNIAEPPTIPAEGERYRLLEAISEMLARLAAERPLVLVLDDLHWADKGTIAMLQQVARTSAAQHVLVLGAYRDVELDRTHPLAAALADLRRQKSFERIALRGLDRADVAELLDTIAEQDVPAALSEAIAAETNGNPFFIKEVLLHLIEERKIVQEDGHWMSKLAIADMGIPEGVREVIGRRLSRLNDACNRMLTTASAMTGGFSWMELRAICEESDAMLLDALDEALRAQVLVEPKIGSYDFTHALIRHTLYEELSTPRRLLLHRRIGEALEALHADDVEPPLAELAHHFYEAAITGDGGRAINYSERAGDRARSQLAYDEAARHYRNVLSLLDLGGRRDEVKRCDVLLSLAEELWHANEWRQAEEAVRQAITIARELNSPQRIARAAIAVSGRWYFWLGQPSSEHLAFMEEALAAVGDTDELLRANLLARLAANILFVPEAEERRSAYMSEALEIARRRQDLPVLAYALVHQHFMVPEAADPLERLGLATEAAALAEEICDMETAMMARLLCLEDQLALGDMVQFDAEFAVVSKLDEIVHQPVISGFLTRLRVDRSIVAGRFDEANSLATEELKRNLANTAPGEETGSSLQLFGVQMLAIRRETGGLDALEPAVRSAVEQFSFLRVYRAALAALYADLDREPDAREQFSIIADAGYDEIAKDMFWMATIALLSEACHYLGDAAEAAKLYDIFSRVSPRTVLVGSGSPYTSLGSSSRYLGLLASTLDRWDEAQRHFEDALAMHERMGAPGLMARTQHDYAKMLLARNAAGDRTRAIELLDMALPTARTLGMAPLVSKAAALRTSTDS